MATRILCRLPAITLYGVVMKKDLVVDLERLLVLMIEQKFTGSLTIHLSQGGIASVEKKEKILMPMRVKETKGKPKKN